MVESIKGNKDFPIPIGQDNLNFKNDPAIMSQLDVNGKPLHTQIYLNFCRVACLQHKSVKVQQVRNEIGAKFDSHN
jgi:hypothetical protein